MNFDIYEPIYTTIPEPTIKIPPYYEVRVWQNHKMRKIEEFASLKNARKFYRNCLKDEEDQGNIYVEIISVKTLKK